MRGLHGGSEKDMIRFYGHLNRGYRVFSGYRSHCVMVQNDKLQSPEDLFLRSFELQKIE
jgi:hypothetical protein